MKSIFKKLKDKIAFKELPPPYGSRCNENDSPVHAQQGSTESIDGATLEVLDLLANCKITSEANDQNQSEVEYAEIKEMGVWQSTPLAHRHKSKISLTWVLKENLENKKLACEKGRNCENVRPKKYSDIDRPQHYSQRLNENDNYRKCNSNRDTNRIIGRNEYYHNLRFQSACDEFTKESDSYSDDSSVDLQYMRRNRHRHRRKKTKQNSKFGYDIKDVDGFLTEASIDRPGNIPVVITYPSILYQTQNEAQQELTLPLGTVVNAVFKNDKWLYAQTPHGDEGYVLYKACLPLGILPNRASAQRKSPCWESSTDVYPRPRGNTTDGEKTQQRRRTRSECRYRNNDRIQPNYCPEKDFDDLYLKTKSVCSLNSKYGHENSHVKRQTLMVVNSNYKGNVLERTVTVQKGEVVVLENSARASTNVDWFYVKKKDGSLGFIPAVIADHGYI
ncbi:uncharacterized protein LOC101736856 [Bombyx mori]